ncbi:citrate synthase [Micromonospora pallida]|uniref:Citrate synthase n=1 Tax=Micromonospora pallida TaxID=145854 RepID=A0A1C6RSK7_9ACTN|nr:citrate/2-methylcitrate synthase [Micromonospora pallida]SCL20032.1 citrate synthase [Micromonospora pallida]
MPDLNSWDTSVTDIAQGVIAYRGTPIGEVIEEADLADALWLVLFGHESSPGGVDALRRALIAALDHGVAAPSTLVSRATASTRGALPLSIAAGLIAFAGPAHGGAAEAAAELFVQIADLGGTETAVSTVVSAELTAGRRVPGYGHPYHDRDPRVPALMNGIEPTRTHRDIAGAVERALLAETGKPLYMNADAAVGALLLDAGLGAAEVTLVTALGRAVGLAAHAREERLNEKPFRAPALTTVHFHPTAETS